MDSFISWVGGKKQLRKEIIKRFPSEGVEKYVEVFGGAGWVLFGKEPHKKEIYNDINGELVNLFRMVKHHPDALEGELMFLLNSREEFFQQKLMRPECMTELQRAARMYYLVKASYGSKVDTFGCGFRDVSVIKNLKEVHKRLGRVLIENKSFEEIIQKQDGEGTLFYLDPPYHGTEKLYDIEGGFGEVEHRKLADILRNTKGKWILSYNDDQFIRDMYNGFRIEEMERSNNLGVAAGGNGIFKELIIKNF
ncbi:Dam family site-specific DNA-(adenine-N6)-methyltransferase [Anaerotignum sp.]